MNDNLIVLFKLIFEVIIIFDGIVDVNSLKYLINFFLSFFVGLKTNIFTQYTDTNLKKNHF